MKTSSIALTFSGSTPYTLTNAYVASDAINVDHANSLTVIPYYAAGTGETGNTIDFVIEINPYDATTDPSGIYWAQIGTYIDSSGTYTERNSNYIVNQGTAGQYEPGMPLQYDIDANRLRIKVKEVGVSTNYGTVRFIILKNDGL